MAELSPGLSAAPFDPARHDRQGFSCGRPSLDSGLSTQASQDIKQRAALYVLTESVADGPIRRHALQGPRRALHRCLEQSRALALALDALNEAAQGFYEHYGFRLLGGVGRRLYLPVRLFGWLLRLLGKG